MANLYNLACNLIIKVSFFLRKKPTIIHKFHLTVILVTFVYVQSFSLQVKLSIPNCQSRNLSRRRLELYGLPIVKNN